MTAEFDLYDPDSYVAGPPHELFARLRREQPVVWQDMPDEPGYWAVLRHADLVHVAREPVLFSAATGGVVLENLPPESLAMMQDMLLAMDPPRHLGYRRNASPHFAPRVMARLEGRIREICQEIMRAAADQTVDFVHDVCAKLPSQVVGELMGIPREDWPRIHAWSEMNSGGQDPDIAAGYAADAAMSATVEMAMYAIELAGRRRAEPADDLTTLMLAVEVDGEAMTDIQFGSFFVQLVTAGNDTTRTMLSSGLLALLQHPDQLAELRAEPVPDPGRARRDPALREPAALFPSDRDRRHVGGRCRDSRRRQGRDDVHVGEPRRGGVRSTAGVRHSPRPEPPPLVRNRRALLSRYPPGAPRGPGVLRRAVRPLPHHRAHRRTASTTVQPQQRAEGTPGPSWST